MLPPYPFIELFPELKGKRIVLCSASPRRKQLLDQVGLQVECITSDFPENIDKDSVTPWEYVSKTATGKALAVYERICDDKKEPSLLIAADTVVLCGHKIMEKPKNQADQLEMLKRLRAEPEGGHRAITAVCIITPDDEMPVAPGYVLKTHVEETTVVFDSELSDDLLLSYVQSGEGLDKAGGYGIQGQGAILIKRILGDHGAVVGLPLNATYRLIQSVLNYDIYAEEINL
ncbi:septum formation protein Maf [Protomyces lactucae-debilis]|uniref:Septum formation protein Maf n=1 Tax=Protomyces lactucae-debilis TaxID=2754530 RepID=A0A1Y2EZS3_PROLT|nr:septum formation protein Maf [Protomyces lactucae-debilis]ORY76957.1 septum formation protein Maf [Protomyces lactucae-debilis]